MRIGPAWVSIGLLAMAAVAQAQSNVGPPLKRGFAGGRFIDEYFGIVYSTKGLDASLPTKFLFAGRIGNSAVVEVDLRESSEVMDRKQWLDEIKNGWKGDGIERSSVEDGINTYSWVRFDQPEANGSMIHHGYAFYPRGQQAFVVHAMSPRSNPSAVAAVEEALRGLRVSDRSNSFRLAHVIAMSQKGDPRAPQIISQAASSYMETGNKALAFLAAAHAEQIAMRQQKAGALDARTAWQLAFDGGTIFASDGQHAQAIAYLRRCATLAEALPDGPNAAAGCRYQMTRSLAQIGRIDTAFRQLASALFGTEDAKTIQSITAQALAEPDLVPLHADGRWKRLFP